LDFWKGEEKPQAPCVISQQVESEVKEEGSLLDKWDPAMDEEEEDLYIAPWDVEK
jgi:hypothetical protein